jgi:hypothetical protein
MSKPLIDHIKLLTSKVKKKRKTNKRAIKHCTKPKKHKNKREKIFYRIMLVVATTKTPTP